DAQHDRPVRRPNLLRLQASQLARPAGPWLDRAGLVFRPIWRAIGVSRAAMQPRISRSLSSGRPLRAGPVGSIRATYLRFDPTTYISWLAFGGGDTGDVMSLITIIGAGLALLSGVTTEQCQGIG